MEILEFENFPYLLKEINDPPTKLYIKGFLPSPEIKLLCVVGTRSVSKYGEDICRQLIQGLAGYPIVIVSGLALGIDGIAHQVALQNNLLTIALPGSSLEDDFIYPRTHLKLSKQILESGGCLLSEFPPGTPGYPINFPQRNRIMAGMSHATLVIEARAKSGTLITAKLATSYNRDVLAVPGSIYSEGSEGPHLLLRLGAALVTSSKDILEILGFVTNSTLFPSSEKKLFDPKRYKECSDVEIKIIELLKDPLEKDELIRRCSSFAQIGTINALLSMLEIKGFVKESLGEFHLT